MLEHPWCQSAPELWKTSLDVEAKRQQNQRAIVENYLPRIRGEIAEIPVFTFSIRRFRHNHHTLPHVPIQQASDSNAFQLETSCSCSKLSEVIQ